MRRGTDTQTVVTNIHFASATPHAKSNKSSAVAERGDRGHNRHGPKKGGGAVPLSRSAGNPSNTMWPAPMSTSVPSDHNTFCVVYDSRKM